MNYYVRIFYITLLLIILSPPIPANAKKVVYLYSAQCKSLNNELETHRKEVAESDVEDYKVRIFELIENCQKASDKGDKEAAKILADTLYHFYNDIYLQLALKNELLDFLKQREKHNDPQAILHLAFFYEHGLLVEQDLEKSFRMLKDTIESLQKEENPEANVPKYLDFVHLLALRYMEGKGVKQDYNESLKWLNVAINHDYTPSIRLKATHYLSGWGVNKNYNKAFEVMQQAAKLGDLEAMYFLAKMYDSGNNAFKDANNKAGDLIVDHDKAYKWMYKAAIRGLPKAQYSLGYYYIQGIGVKRNMEIAAEWINQAAFRGHEEAQEIVKGSIEANSKL